MLVVTPMASAVSTQTIFAARTTCADLNGRPTCVGSYASCFGVYGTDPWNQNYTYGIC